MGRGGSGEAMGRTWVGHGSGWVGALGRARVGHGSGWVGMGHVRGMPFFANPCAFPSESGAVLVFFSQVCTQIHQSCLCAKGFAAKQPSGKVQEHNRRPGRIWKQNRRPLRFWSTKPPLGPKRQVFCAGWASWGQSHVMNPRNPAPSLLKFKPRPQILVWLKL